MVQFRFLFSIVILSCLTACKIDRKDTVDRDKFSFRYTDDSYLFFRNVRSLYYDLQDLPAARWHAYRHYDRYKGNERPSIHPVIVVDWEKMQANLLIEANDRIPPEQPITIREINRKSKATYSYTLSQRGRDNMLEFGTKIYEGIMSENQLFLKSGEEYVPLFTDEDEADIFRVVMSDYYRLTRIF